MHASYEIIKRCRDLLAAIPKSMANENTAASYRLQMERLLQHGHTPDAIIRAAQDTTKVSAWFSRRAAITYVSREQIEKMLQIQDQQQRRLKSLATDDAGWSDWQKYIRNMGKWAVILATVHTTPSLPKEKRKNRHSKKADMRKLPTDWRERLVKRMPHYRLAIMAIAVCGCRPSEIARGIELEIIEGQLHATIQGAKMSSLSGQPWRRLAWSLSTESGLVKELIEEVKHSGGKCTVRIDSAKNFHSAVRSAGQREWPSRLAAVTPYCFRHAAASDMKAAGLPHAEISAGLGHCVDVTKERYGHARMGSKGGVSPTKVIAARLVKRKGAPLYPSRAQASALQKIRK